MHRSIALLRGINIGGHNRVPMAELRQVLTEAGYTEISTYIQSGNVGLSAADVIRGEDIVALVAGAFGVDVPVVVIKANDLARIADQNPFVPDVDDQAKLLVFFLDRVPEPDAVEAFDVDAYEPDRCVVADRAVYAHYPNGVARSRLTGAAIERGLGLTATARNMRTVDRLRRL